MALNVWRIVVQWATLFDKKENDNFYTISIEIIVFCLVRDIYVLKSFYIYKIVIWFVNLNYLLLELKN